MAHTNFVAESDRDLKLKRQEIDFKTEKRTAQEAALEAAKKDLAQTHTELQAAEDYHKKLVQSCVLAAATAEERVAQREKEIQSLQEVYNVLGGNTTVSST